MRFIGYGLTITWVLLIAWPLISCLAGGCSANLFIDGFLPAFMFAPVGISASLWSIGRIGKGRWPRLGVVLRYIGLAIGAIIAIYIIYAVVLITLSRFWYTKSP